MVHFPGRISNCYPWSSSGALCRMRVEMLVHEVLLLFGKQVPEDELGDCSIPWVLSCAVHQGFTLYPVLAYINIKGIEFGFISFISTFHTGYAGIQGIGFSMHVCDHDPLLPACPVFSPSCPEPSLNHYSPPPINLPGLAEHLGESGTHTALVVISVSCSVMQGSNSLPSV